jgi:hypothetical protein
MTPDNAVRDRDSACRGSGALVRRLKPLRSQPQVARIAFPVRTIPGCDPTGAQLRTLRRRVQLWRNMQIRRLIFQASEIRSVNHNGEGHRLLVYHYYPCA